LQGCCSSFSRLSLVWCGLLAPVDLNRSIHLKHSLPARWMIRLRGKVDSFRQICEQCIVLKRDTYAVEQSRAGGNAEIDCLA